MAELVFLGTKGNIESLSREHKYHSSVAVKEKNTKIMIDFGTEHKYDFPGRSKADGLLITHAHPDHYAWAQINVNTRMKVYLTQYSYHYGKHKPKKFQVIKPEKQFVIGEFKILPYSVIHSIRCPAIGFKITISSETVIVYNPDVIDIENKDSILADANYYIGDGSSIRTSLVRKKAEYLFGHAKVSTQVNWCRKYGIDNIIFTHLGQDTIKNKKEFLEKNPEVVFAEDGMKVNIC
ncbi:MAG: MBL fold metallo-hydrolase [Desulfobacterales bacterium]